MLFRSVEVEGEKELIEYSVDDLKFKRRHKKEKTNLDDAELRELENLEKREGKSKLGDD